jgi:hypothetical protein
MTRVAFLQRQLHPKGLHFFSREVALASQKNRVESKAEREGFEEPKKEEVEE